MSFLLLEENLRGRNDQHSVACRCSFPALLLRVIKCATAFYIRLADKASWLSVLGAVWRILEAHHPGFNFLKYVHASVSVCSRSHKGFHCCRSFLHTLAHAHTDDILCVDSVIHSRLWSPSIRTRTHLTSTSKASSLVVIWKPAPPTPRLAASLPCFSGVCTQRHYSSLMSAQPVKDGVKIKHTASYAEELAFLSKPFSCTLLTLFSCVTDEGMALWG